MASESRTDLAAQAPLGPTTHASESGSDAAWMELTPEQCKSIFGELTLAAVALGVDATVLHANPEFLRLTGWLRNEAIGADWVEAFIAEEDRELVRERIRRVWAGERVPPVLNRVRFRDGSVHLMRWHDGLIRSESGSQVALLKIGEDLLEVDGAHHRLGAAETKLDDAREELQATKAALTQLRSSLGYSEAKLDEANDTLIETSRRLAAIFDTAVEGIIIISQSGVMEQFNEAAERLFGYRKDEVLGRNVSMLMPEPYRRNHDGYLANYLKTGEAKIIGIGREAMGARKDGSVFPIKLAISEVRSQDRIVFAGFIEDLTERKRLEREAEEWRAELERRVEARTAELARANRELEHFAHTISHDLRTPLRGIRNYVDFLREDLSGKISGESEEDLGRLGKASDELERMIQELLDYTRIGRRQSAPENFMLGDLLEDIARVLGKEPGVEIVIAPDLPRITAPSGTVRQVFQNLMENGLQYNASSPRRVEITGVRVTDGPNPRWRFDVADNGIGIDPLHHEKIFMMFQRLHNDEEYPGTGIGLAAVRKAAEHLGGGVRVVSEPGKGSIFQVELPEKSE